LQCKESRRTAAEEELVNLRKEVMLLGELNERYRERLARAPTAEVEAEQRRMLAEAAEKQLAMAEAKALTARQELTSAKGRIYELEQALSGKESGMAEHKRLVQRASEESRQEVAAVEEANAALKEHIAEQGTEIMQLQDKLAQASRPIRVAHPVSVVGHAGGQSFSSSSPGSPMYGGGGGGAQHQQQNRGGHELQPQPQQQQRLPLLSSPTLPSVRASTAAPSAGVDISRAPTSGSTTSGMVVAHSVVRGVDDRYARRPLNSVSTSIFRPFVVGSPPQSSGGSFGSSDNSSSVRRMMARRQEVAADTDDDFPAGAGGRSDRQRGARRGVSPSIPDEDEDEEGVHGHRVRGGETRSSAGSMNGH